MRIRVLYFGMLKDLVGRQADEVDLREGATLRDLVAQCESSQPSVKDFRQALAFSVNQEYASMSQMLRDGDEVALLPPVSGGTQSGARCLLVRDRIDAQKFCGEIKRPEDGAVSTFDGIVRNNTRGRVTLYLDYEAYEEMALKQMEQLCEQAIERFKIRDARIIHRLGRLEIGETSVLIAVASAHRSAALDACRFLIDTLKKTVPIWKKEYFQDGAVWADGEPFPEHIRGDNSSDTEISKTKLSKKTNIPKSRNSASK